MTNSPQNFEIHACVLAAGSSLRYGATKLIQDFHGKPLVQHALLCAQALCPKRVTLVVGHDHENVVRAANDVQDQLAVNENYRDGIASSIAVAAHATPQSADAIIVMLADQPLITRQHLHDIASLWSGKSKLIVASTFDETDSPPILFPRAAFGLLKELGGDTGAKALLANDGFAVCRIPFAPAKFDVDTPDDLACLRSGNYE